MANMNIASLLDRPTDDIKPPPLLPVGSYLTILSGLPEQIESSKKKTPGLRFKHKIISALEDVDPEALALIDGGVVGKEIRNDMWVTEDSLFMLKDFLGNCGIEVEGRKLNECIDETPNTQVVIVIKHDVIGDGDRFIAKVGRTAKAE